VLRRSHLGLCDENDQSTRRIRISPVPAGRTKGFGGLTRRLRSPGFHETEHRLLQLRINFVCDGHHVEQHGAEIHASKIVLKFLTEISKEERSDLSKAVRDLVTLGRVLLAVERYRKGEASWGKAAELAGLPGGRMMTILAEFGVEGRIEKEDYLQGLHNLAKVGKGPAQHAPPAGAP